MRRWKKPSTRPALPCDRKKSYNTYEQAVAMAIRRVEEGSAEYLRAYQCQIPACRRFHLTSQRRDDQRYPAFVAGEDAE